MLISAATQPSIPTPRAAMPKATPNTNTGGSTARIARAPRQHPAAVSVAPGGRGWEAGAMAGYAEV
ncbi:hypothetical protein GCM10017643_10850 [Ancylobacter dichloromethanicus]|uniref:Uncharacterized protein n=1 Tax=Ancylobacter dichloromethanicus TaxID=518825 RepID=A0A9W6J822_9HYPH|nr:hypothetical protein GCM10017643_10850 [Ancylobacter dichloromethanicus]